jgi:hypothetical protein
MMAAGKVSTQAISRLRMVAILEKVARCTVRGQLAAQRAHHMGTPVQAVASQFMPKMR